MKRRNNISSTYATVKGGKIAAPNKQKDEPRATKTVGSDLRIKRG